MDIWGLGLRMGSRRQVVLILGSIIARANGLILGHIIARANGRRVFRGIFYLVQLQ